MVLFYLNRNEIGKPLVDVLLRNFNMMHKIHQKRFDGEVIPGLYTRRPTHYWHPGVDVVSHDEYTGLVCAFGLCPSTRSTKINEIVKYGKEYDWVYNDKRPNFKYWRWVLTNPLKAFNQYREYKKLTKVDDKKGSIFEAIRDDYEILDITYMRQHRDRAFYKIMSTDYKPSFFEVCYLAIANILTARKSDTFPSTELMCWYRMKVIEEFGLDRLNWLYRVILSYSHEVSRKYFRKVYGSEYVQKMHKLYFRDYPKGHPFWYLTKGLR